MPDVRALTETRARRPEAIAEAAAARRRPAAPGLVVGRSLLFPPDDEVTAAVDAAVALLPREVAA